MNSLSKLKKFVLLIGLLLALSTVSLYGNQQKLVDYARSKIGIDYRYNGRETSALPDMDCMGLCFKAYASVYKERWTRYSVIPSKLIKAGDLGYPIDNRAHIYSEDMIKLLQPGDIVYFVVDYKAIVDEAVVTEGDVSYWVYHMGIYSEAGKIIHASPWAGKTVEEDLINFQSQFRFFITRRG